MPHHTPLISTIVVALVLAFILGAIANRFRVSPLVGYLLAGVLIGPFTPGYVADRGIAREMGRQPSKGKPAPDLVPGPVPGTAAPEAAAETATRESIPATALTNHVVLVGYGRVGRVVGGGLKARQIPVLLIEEDMQAAEGARGAVAEVIHGTATDREVLDAANLAGARCLIVGIPDAFEGGQVVAQARAINPRLYILARSHSDEETAHLEKHGASKVIMGEHEIAMAMLDDLPPGANDALMSLGH